MTESGDDVTVAYPLFQAESGGSTPTSPLQLQVGSISTQKFLELNKLWHSRLPLVGNAFKGVGQCYGAEYDGKYYAVAYWSNPVSCSIKEPDTYELRRMAVGPDAPKYTATRFLAIMIRLLKKHRPTLTKLISYQDTEVHTGTIYKASGWVAEYETKFSSWTRNKRQRNDEQSKAAKIRWAKEL